MRNFVVSGLKNKTLGILLATSPENFNKQIVIGITEAAIKLGVKVKIFLMDDGIYNLHDNNFMRLIELGAEISYCEQNARERKIERVEHVRSGSQYDHAELVKNCDRYLGFFR